MTQRIDLSKMSEWYMDQIADQLAEQMKVSPFFRNLTPACDPILGPHVPNWSSDSGLYVQWDGDYLTFECPGYESETARLEASEVDELIAFLIAWRSK